MAVLTVTHMVTVEVVVMFLLSEMFKKEKVSFLSRVASENVCVMGTCSYVDYPLW